MAEDLFNLEAEKSWLFEIASKSMRTYKNHLRCAYALQVFGSQLKREIANEKRKLKEGGASSPSPLKSAIESEARDMVHDHYRGEFNNGNRWNRVREMSTALPWSVASKAAKAAGSKDGGEAKVSEVGECLDDISFADIPLKGLLELQRKVSGLQQRLSDSVEEQAAAAESAPAAMSDAMALSPRQKGPPNIPKGPSVGSGRRASKSQPTEEQADTRFKKGVSGPSPGNLEAWKDSRA
jgi:hypothetical protein